MTHGHPHGGTLLLRPDHRRAAPRTGRTTRGARGSAPRGTARSADRTTDPDPGTAVRDHPAPTADRFRSPALVLLAAAAIFLGYCQLGVIATSGAHWSWVVTGRPAVLAEGALLLGVGLALTRRTATAPRAARAPVAGAGTMVAAASVVAAVTGRRTAYDVLGTAELLVAAAALGTVLALERRRSDGAAGPATDPVRGACS